MYVSNTRRHFAVMSATVHRQTFSVPRGKSQSPKLPFHATSLVLCGSHLFLRAIAMNQEIASMPRYCLVVGAYSV